MLGLTLSIGRGRADTGMSECSYMLTLCEWNNALTMFLSNSGMKFLRKNECKRHESSHEGRKPYSCSICAPLQDRSFVRQDLLKRHLRVTHGLQDTAGRRRKGGVKKDNDADFWP